MSGAQPSDSVRRLYRLTALFGAIGFVSYFALAGGWPALAFGLGALASFGNLWLFDRLAASIAPGDAPRKPLQAGAFALRYIILFALAYAIIKGLGASPLAVVLGLLVSTAAVIVSSICDLILDLRAGRRTN